MLPSYLLLASLIALISTVAFALLSRSKRAHRLPPGPFGWPILGNLPQLNAAPLHILLQQMSQRYGPLMTLTLGSVKTVVISREDVAHDALISQASKFASRPQPYSWRYFGNYKGVITSVYGPNWLKLRKIVTNHVLSPAKIGAYRSIRQSETVSFLCRLRGAAEVSDGVIQPLLNIRLAVSSIMARLCFGDEFSEKAENGDEKSRKLEECLRDVMEMTSVMQLGDYIPMARALPSSRSRYKRYVEMEERIKQFLLPIIASRRKLLEQNGDTAAAAGSFIDILLSLENREEQLTNLEVQWHLTDLIIAGTDTVTSTLEWALAYMVALPEIQKRAHEEIKQAVPGDGFVHEEDLEGLQYVQAIIKETLRKSGPAVLAVPHATTEDCKLMGYDIPANTQVLINQHAILNDAKVWGDPEAFRPERHLDERGRLTAQDPISYTAFGAGRRMCPGMNMAKTHLHLLLANLLWAFEWRPVVEPVDLTSRLQFLCTLKNPLQARIIERRKS